MNSITPANIPVSAAWLLCGALLAAPAPAALVDNGDGTVSDTATGLMWAQDMNLFKTMYNALPDNAAKDAFMNNILAVTPTIADPAWGANHTMWWDDTNIDYVNIFAVDFNVAGHTAGDQYVMSVYGAQAFVNYLNSIRYVGYNDWRLPEHNPLNGTSYNYSVAGNANSFQGASDMAFNMYNAGAWPGLDPKNAEMDYLFSTSLGKRGRYTLAGTDRSLSPGSLAHYGLLATSVYPGDPASAGNGSIAPFINGTEEPYLAGNYFDSFLPGLYQNWSYNFKFGRNVNVDRAGADINDPLLNGLVLPVRASTGSANPVLGTIQPFGEQTVGTHSAAQTVTLSNSGGANYVIQSITASTEYTSNHDCGNRLGAGQSCSIQVVFQPSLTGQRPGTLTVTPHAGSPLTLALSGTGIGTAPHPEFGSIDAFPAQNLFTTSSPQALTLSNTGTAEFAIQAITAAGDFAVVSHTCGTALAANGECTVSISFTPTAVGNRSGTVTVTQAVSGATVTKDLAGTGASAGYLEATPAALDFGAVPDGRKAQLFLTLRNAGTEELWVANVSGPEAPFAKATDRCSGKRLQPGKSCRIAFKYASSGNADPVTGQATIAAEGLNELAVALSGRTADQPGALEVTTTETQDIGLAGQFSLAGGEFTSHAGKVLVGGRRAAILAWTDTQIIAKAPRLAANTYPAEVVRKGETPTGTGQASLTVHVPEISGLTRAGATLTVNGRYFGSVRPSVRFTPEGGRAVSGTATKGQTDSQIRVKLPRRVQSGEYSVAVKNSIGTSNSLPLPAAE